MSSPSRCMGAMEAKAQAAAAAGVSFWMSFSEDSSLRLVSCLLFGMQTKGGYIPSLLLLSCLEMR